MTHNGGMGALGEEKQSSLKRLRDSFENGSVLDLAPPP
jgi:hypothetical protein